MSKTDAKKLVEYIELVSESKVDPELKNKLDEMLETHGITEKPLNESQLTGIIGVPRLGVITDVKTTGNSKVNVDAGKDSGVQFDSKSKTIIAKIKSGSKVGGGKPSQLKTLDGDRPSLKVGKAGKLKGILTLDIHKSGPRPSVKLTGAGPTAKNKSDQKLKLDQKPVGKLKEDKSSELTSRRSKIDEKLSKIIDDLEKEKKLDEKQTKLYPFLNLLTEGERKEFSILDSTNKEKVAKEIVNNPTTDTGIIRNLWTSALAEDVEDKTPLWMKVAPKKYKELFEKANDERKGAIKARAEFYDLQTQYQINNFWETSGLNNNKILSLNEAVMAKTPEESDKKLDSFVASVGEAMEKYN